mgnify:CR=1 FL=1
MATNNAIDEAYLESLANKQATALDNVLAQQTETLDQLVNRKKEDLGLKSEEKTKGIEGISSMKKADLIKALNK